jgi:Family of unknown function (DUF6169)
MNTLLPYNFFYNEGQHRFVTDNGIIYGISFTDGSFYFPYLPSDILMYEFSIKVIDLGDNPTPPFDARFEVTIVEIMKLFFANNLNSLIYICETLDNRQHSRFRKFDLWFKKNIAAIPQLEKYDASFTYEDTDILSSMILHQNNIHKHELIEIFFDRNNIDDK